VIVGYQLDAASRIKKIRVMSIRHTSRDSKVSVGCCVTNQSDKSHDKKA